MSTVRVSVEWVFGEIINFFKFMDFKKNFKIGLSPVAKMYVVCALMQNARCCFYTSTTSNFFNCEPPTIEDYLKMNKINISIDYKHTKLARGQNNDQSSLCKQRNFSYSEIFFLH